MYTHTHTHTHIYIYMSWAPLMAQLVKDPPTVQKATCNAGDLGSIPESGRIPGEVNGNSF